MFELTQNQVRQVSGGDCEVELAGYLVATAGIMVASGPVGWGLAIVSWGLAAYGLDSCESEASS